MPRFVETHAPSFPEVAADVPIAPVDAQRWQVLCGDTAHWRVGLYSPVDASREALRELERHDCPELFLLLSGRLTLLLSVAGQLREVPLEVGKPVLVTSPHNGYCPDGPHTGRALVVERDVFATEYRGVNDW
jgi:hypothetical protein